MYRTHIGKQWFSQQVTVASAKELLAVHKKKGVKLLKVSKLTETSLHGNYNLYLTKPTIDKLD